jgi:hypothetical protein
MKIKHRLFFLTPIVLFSCSVLKPPAEIESQVKLNRDNLNLINGTYNRYAIDSVKSNPSDLFWGFSLKGYNGNEGEDFVKLIVEDEHHIRVSLIMSDSIIQTKTIKGKIRENTFEFNRRFIIIPVIVATIYKDSKVRISLMENGNLNVDAKTMAYGLTFFILPVGGVEQKYRMEFERKNDK